MAKFDLKNNPELAKERKNAQNRAYYARHREQIKNAHKQWRMDNPGYDAQWMKDKRTIS